MDEAQTKQPAADGSVDLVDQVDRHFREAADYRLRFEDVKRQGLRRYLGDHWDKQAPKGLMALTLNRTQNSIISSAAIQIENPPGFNVVPVESGEEPLMYLGPLGRQKLAALGNTLGLQLDPAKAGGLEPLSPEEHRAVLMARVPTDPVLGGADEMVFAPEDFVEVSDATVAEALTLVFGVMWRRMRGQELIVDNILRKLVYGHQPMILELTHDRKCPFRLINAPVMNVWIDPLATDIHDAEYVIWDQVMSVNEAVSRYPGHAAAIREQAENDSPDFAVYGNSYTRNIDAVDRDMLVLRTCWLRHHTRPMEMAEALAEGAVSRTPAIPAGDGAPAMVPGLVDRKGRPVTEGGPGWPSVPCVRQVRIIGSAVLEDAPCPFHDIPVGWNINKPHPASAYGLGEPERLEDISQGINRIFSNIQNIIKYGPSPSRVMPQSVMAAIGDDKMGRMHSHPGQIIAVDDSAWMQFGGNIIQELRPPTFTVATVEALQLCLQEHDNLSGNQDVLQGRTSGGVEAASAIRSLQSAARGSISFTVDYTERTLRHIAELVIKALPDCLSQKQWSRLVSGQPPEILLAMIAKAKDMDYDVRVEITNAAADKQARKAEAKEEFSMGLKSKQDTLERLDDPNPRRTLERLAREEEASLMQAGAQEQPPRRAENGSTGN